MVASKRFVLVIAALWALLFVFSIAGRQAPEFRPWERLFDAEHRRFLPNRVVEMETIGDLAFKSWNREDHRPRKNRFTTDRYGFRNAVHIEAPEIVVIGDSYVAGAGLSDDETVTTQLAQRLEEPVYNFAAESLNAPARFLEEKRFAQDRPKIVVWAPVARGIKARPLLIRRDEAAPSTDSVSFSEPASEWFRTATAAMNRDNGLVRESRFGLQGLLQRFRPNPYRRTLPNGETVLALSLAEQGLLVSPQDRNVDHCVEMVSAFSRLLSARGVRLVFSPVPDVGTTYPQLYSEAELRARPEVSFLTRLIDGVKARGVEVVDLRPVFLEKATPYLYLADDTHWNGRATALAADAWAERIRTLPEESRLTSN